MHTKLEKVLEDHRPSEVTSTRVLSDQSFLGTPGRASKAGREQRRLACQRHSYISPYAEQDKDVFESHSSICWQQMGKLAAGFARGFKYSVAGTRAMQAPSVSLTATLPASVSGDPRALLLTSDHDAGAADLAVAHARVHGSYPGHTAGLAHGKWIPIPSRWSSRLSPCWRGIALVPSTTRSLCQGSRRASCCAARSTPPKTAWSPDLRSLDICPCSAS